ncbi:hypothetical protein ACFVT5_09515 [Streptomyces sp. NPDC058001]|uniref:hypothetical protein n=1 Tax=Streptomyces sp. NPDC058001 TaxID=3346300 RepID=UPI0036ED0211
MSTVRDSAAASHRLDADTGGGESGDKDNVRRVARRVTDLFQPRNVLLAGMTGIGLAAAGHWSGALWGLLGALCAGIVPAAYIERERRRGTFGDRHVVDRTQRAPIFFVILGSVGTGATVMAIGGAPVGILATMLGLWCMTVILLAVNTVWKISVDAAVASATVSLLATVHTVWWAVGYVLVTAVCWSRVALAYHSPAQTLAGAALGAATPVAYLLA